MSLAYFFVVPVGHCDKEGTEVVQLISLVPLLASGLQAAPENGTGFFAFPFHLVQPLSVRSSCHRRSHFPVRMTRDTVFIGYSYAHGTV